MHIEEKKKEKRKTERLPCPRCSLVLNKSSLKSHYGTKKCNYYYECKKINSIDNRLIMMNFELHKNLYNLEKIKKKEENEKIKNEKSLNYQKKKALANIKKSKILQKKLMKIEKNKSKNNQQEIKLEGKDFKDGEISEEIVLFEDEEKSLIQDSQDSLIIDDNDLILFNLEENLGIFNDDFSDNQILLESIFD